MNKLVGRSLSLMVVSAIAAASITSVPGSSTNGATLTDGQANRIYGGQQGPQTWTSYPDSECTRSPKCDLPPGNIGCNWRANLCGNHTQFSNIEGPRDICFGKVPAPEHTCEEAEYYVCMQEIRCQNNPAGGGCIKSTTVVGQWSLPTDCRHVGGNAP